MNSARGESPDTSERRDLKRIPLAIMRGDEIVGEVLIKDIEPRDRATLGIVLKNARYKDQGIGTQAERLAVRYVFRELDIPTLYADTIRTNTRSQHVLEKVGFSADLGGSGLQVLPDRQADGP